MAVTTKHRRQRRTLWRTLPSRAGYIAQQFLTWPIAQLRERMMSSLGERVEVRGVLVIIDVDEAEDRELVYIGLSKAMENIEASAPHMRRRIVCDVRQLLVQPESAAAYLHPGTILIPLQAFDHADDDAIAGYIIHEAVHARIANMGIRYWPHLRARIERRCLREQIAFFESRGRADLVHQFEQYATQRWPLENAL